MITKLFGFCLLLAYTLSAEATSHTITVSNGRFDAPYYTFTPALTELVRGDTYTFVAGQEISSIHPFAIGTSYAQYIGNSNPNKYLYTGPNSFYSTSPVASRSFTFTVPLDDTTTQLVYFCTETLQ